MTSKKKKIEQRKKILQGLEKTWDKLVQYKKEKNSDLVILENDQVVHVKPA
jgi:hypothetical protein